jgi:hypothetical protein
MLRPVRFSEYERWTCGSGGMVPPAIIGGFLCGLDSLSFPNSIYSPGICQGFALYSRRQILIQTLSALALAGAFLYTVVGYQTKWLRTREAGMYQKTWPAF